MERTVSIDTGNRTLRNINARRTEAMGFPAEMTLFASSKSYVRQQRARWLAKKRVCFWVIGTFRV